jgi:1,3,6,8-tetrahydroxynaphthalene synthase
LTLDDTISTYRRVYADHPKLEQALAIARNTSVKKRHFIQTVEDSYRHPGLERRHAIYEQAAKSLAPACIRQALDHADLDVQDIHQIIAVSCTGFLFPSLAAWLINTMGFSHHTKQLPIAQMGCAAGASAINRAHEYCTAFPDQNVLIVCVEFSSMVYQPTNESLGDLLSYSLFGDAVSACIMKGDRNVERKTDGIRITQNASYLVPNTERYIAYDLKETGFHFVLHRDVRKTMESVAPVMSGFLKRRGLSVDDLGYFILHTGGPQIMNELIKHLGVAEEKIRHSRQCLEDYGNVASVVVFDVLRRTLEDKDRKPAEGAVGIMAGFGPGVTAEMNLSCLAA